ncbi:hypothetical protein PBRA_007849 [Plasmodiophora brassicae]|nr:hypothetical protein PBRA_007849 [Plasmodiophora brassicae]
MQGAGDGEEVIDLEQGWAHCRDTGINPLLQRIETAFDDGEFERCTIKAETYMDVYDKVFKMCIQRDPNNHSEQLYVRYTEAIRMYLQGTVVPELARARSQNEVLFLREWNKRWKYQKILVQGLSGMFTYIDRFYVPNADDKLPLASQGFDLYSREVYEQYKANAKDAILSAVAKEREGEQQDANRLQTAVNVFVELGARVGSVALDYYRGDLETPLIEATKSYYFAHGRAWLDEDTCPAYMVKAEAVIRSESGRVDAYLHPSTKPKLILAVQHELLQQHQIELMEKPTGINALLEQGAQDDLSRMYRLFKEVEDGVKHIAKALRDHVKQIGVGYIEASKEEPATPAAPGQSDDHDLVKKLIALHDTYLNIVKTCMASDTIVEKALREAFEDAINREHYTSNLLAKFVNALLTKGSKVSVATFEQTLDHVVMLYGYIRDKDIFEEEYQMYLANRLLASKSESHQAEKTMIAKLKSECGYHWTSKLESMFKDVQLSDELMQQFVATCGREFQTELHVNVCTMGRWPSAVLPTCNMPAQLKRLTDRFKMFYVNKHSGKKIEYQMDKGEADVSVRFADADPSSGVRANAKLLVVSTFQMVILLMYNQRTEFTFQEIADGTGIPRADLETHLLSLAHPKVKVLSKTPNTKDIRPDHVFALNTSYASKLFRVKVPLMKAPTKKSVGVDPKLQTQRRHQIDAAIVRIMKTRQRLHHNQLVSEVIKQLQRFKPAAADIKKRVENLIEQEYLERDDADRRYYNYLA